MAKYYESEDHFCIACGKSIDHRSPQSTYCKDCSRIIQKLNSNVAHIKKQRLSQSTERYWKDKNLKELKAKRLRLINNYKVICHLINKKLKNQKGEA